MAKKKPPKGSRKQLVSKMVMIFIFLAGILVMLYPFYSNAINDFVDRQRLEQVQQKNEVRSKEEKARIKAEMKKKNEELAVNGLVPSADPFDENAEQKIISDDYATEHLIGAISIPSIKITIPLFDLTNDKLLQIGATILQGTSYPTGGPSTHSVISAHSGLPEKKLFTDVEELEKGDVFVLTVLDEKLAYEVERIEVVKPNDTSKLVIEKDRDLATLLTCTPYMINSHRLLVTGHRVPYTEKIAKQIEKADQERTLLDSLLLAGVILAVLILLFGIYRAFAAYLLKKERFDLIIKRVDETGAPIEGLELALYTKSGKKAIIRDQVPVTGKTDSDGTVIFKDLPGAVYAIKEAGQLYRLKAGIKKRKQLKAKAYPTRRQTFATNQTEEILIRK
ncbi:class C sortase [Enterococcus florum]|uniref:Class C sortase n=1 Tax=Enterococcus florum TaxID=2480627 RepID=A0A4V0WPJ0_9ENTE|nr:class C sortase [Enterococcus florum]GCF94029.1 class C sortase [Enterococcus florum]